MRNLFICLTPLHVVVSFLFSERSPHDVILLVDQKGGLGDFYALVKDAGLFGNFHYLNSKENFLTDLASYLGLGCFARQGVGFFARNIVRGGVDRVFVFNDLAPEAQYLMNSVIHKKCIYIEDGSAPYNGHYISRKWGKQLFLKLFFKFYDQINVLGTSRYVASGFYSSPFLVRYENRVKPVDKLSFLDERMSDLVLFFSRQRKCVEEDLSVLIFIPPDGDPVAFIEKVKDIVRRKGGGNDGLLLKKHPLDQRVINYEGGFFVEDFVPGDFIPCIYPKISYVFGVRTTALQNIKNMFPDIFVYNVVNGEECSYDSVLRALGVESIELL